MRLKQQLLALTLAPLAAAITVVALLVWPPVNHLLEAAAEKDAHEQLDVQVQSLDAQLRTLQARLDAYASLPAVREGTPESISQLVHPLAATVPGVDVVNFIAIDGSIRVPGDSQIRSARDRYYFPMLQRGEPVVTKAIQSISSKVPEVLILRPVRNSKGEVTGAMGASLRLTDVLQRIQAIKLAMPGFALLVDEDGRTLSSAPFTNVTTTTALFADSTPAQARPEWQHMIAAMRARDNDTTTLAIDGQRYRMFFRKIPTLGWRLAVGFNEDDMFAVRNRVALRGALAFLLLGAISAAAAAAIRRAVVIPVASIASAHAAVARGDFAARAPEPPQSELGDLARSFNRMADDLLEHRRQREADEAMLREMFEASPMAIALYRATDRTYLRVNTAYARLFGLTPAQLTGRTVDEIGVVPDMAERELLRAKLARDGELQGERLKRADENGIVRDYVFSAIPVQVGEDRLILFMTVDISETVRLEAQLRQTQKLDLVGQLAGGVAHDFNNMLAGIMGASDLMAMEPGMTPAMAEEVAVIRDSARRAASLTQQLLMFSRVQPVSRQRFDLHQPVRAALALARRTVDRRIVIEENLNATMSSIIGDAALLQTVVMNLTINARDAMPESGTLRVSTRMEGSDRIRLDVSDTGHGIPSELLDRIFEPFFTTKPPGKGTGLGLSVVFGIVKEHGGSITVKSEPGLGTTVSLYFPVAGASPVKSNPVSPVASMTSGSARILVVDDEPLVRGTIRRALMLAGHSVLTASDGAEAVSLVERGERFDLLVLDLVMPGMGGVSVLRALRLHMPGVPAIVCSGYGAETAFQQLEQETHVALLSKPFGIADLTSLVASITRATQATTVRV